MEQKNTFLTLLMLVLFSFLQTPGFATTKASRESSYVVYLGAHSPNTMDDEAVLVSHHQLLTSILKSKDKAKDAIFYSYTKHINGFAANLDENEANEILKHPSVVSVFPNRGHKLHTTRSWEFLGLEKDGRVLAESLWSKTKFGEDTIIGNLDTGVWPESESFKDEGIGPVPSKWKGICQNDKDKRFTCSRKLIGARYFNKGYRAVVGNQRSISDSPRDTEGHGTHTLSTAGGSFVANASIFGYGTGTTKGGSPRARVAAYKVCWPPFHGGECFDADILAAFDMAIHDGVDVLSLSLGGYATDYFNDGLAIGSFHAMQKGISVICSAGNSGPTPASVSNTAPWILTVGASTMDREFPAYVSFSDNQIKGQSLSSLGLTHKHYAMISSIEAKAANSSAHDAQLCYLNSLDPDKVKGKIVVCLRGINARVEKGEAVHLAGGAGMVLANDKSTGDEIIADAHVLPATHISYSDGVYLFTYLNSTKSPLGYITLPKTKIDTSPAPVMAAFSSQGPNSINPEILKPDITAPGVSILAAYSTASSPTGLSFDARRTPFNVESGTSMSCPHISGVVGLLTTLHPTWSPAMIKSAIMTTARIRDNKEKVIKNSSMYDATPFNYGAGHVMPNHAMDPGLVYDITPSDYLDFLCALGYNSTRMRAFNNESHSCPLKPMELENLNYPSISIPNLFGSKTVTRTVTNVGPPGKYIAVVYAPRGVSVTVKPAVLEFEKFGELKKFKVTIKVIQEEVQYDAYVFGRLIWSDGMHHVRSPLVVKAKY
ncbi:Tripeptidyl-peptidase II protein [Dioscorea alata]|uniref:Tripeptidyl-peptidase II protein n=1 Tax=Dioscorea alata TaxID=55571 RepID=A0ACB7W978_DIOAL|nr:Tripeptidyl-peptidase II protein [Dioscorea alata]